MSLKATLLFICLLTAAKAFSEDFPSFPSSTTLHPVRGDRHTITVSCTPVRENPSGISCQFLQISVSLKTQPSEVDELISKTIKEIEEEDGYKKNPVAEIKKLCIDDLKKLTEVKKELLESATERARDTRQRYFELIKNACDVTTAAQAKSLMEDLITITTEWESLTCNVWSNSWTEDFVHKVSGDGRSYWLAQPDPSGECGAINVSTLRNNAQDEYFWDYESRRIVTNKSGATALGAQCKDVPERTAAYQWRPATHHVDCQEIKFGFM